MVSLAKANCYTCNNELGPFDSNRSATKGFEEGPETCAAGFILGFPFVLCWRAAGLDFAAIVTEAGEPWIAPKAKRGCGHTVCLAAYWTPGPPGFPRLVPLDF